MSNLARNLTFLAEAPVNQSNSTEFSINQLQSFILDFSAVFMTFVAIVGCVVNLMILVLFTKYVYFVVFF